MLDTPAPNRATTTNLTSDQFKVGFVELRTETAESRAEQRTEIADVRTAPRSPTSKPVSSAGRVGTVLATGRMI